MVELTSAWAYLNIEDPLVAWLVYRGEVYSAAVLEASPEGAWTPLSIFHTGRLRSSSMRPALYQTELSIERERSSQFPAKTSRLRGFYVFGNKECAREAERSWDGSFRSEFLCELGVDPASRITRYDSKWITECFMTGPGTWVENYLRGVPYDSNPLWEYVIEGRASVVGTDLRTRAYEVVARTWPDSRPLLELGRIAADLGSTLGRITGLPMATPDGIRVRFILDMKDADSPEFMSRFEDYTRNPNNRVNRADLSPISEHVWFRAPDLRPAEFLVATT